jgi:hypothetical protein
MSFATTGLIAVAGVVALTGMGIAPTAGSRQVAVLVPPWQSDGFEQVAATGLAIVDLHWRAHVFILDTGGDPNALTRLRAQGFWLLDATGTAICGTETKGT